MVIDRKRPQFLGQKIPRDQRDTLFILAVLTFILIPHFFYLPIWAIALTLVTVLWRAWISKDLARKLPGKTVRFLLLCVYVGLTLITYKTFLGPEAGGCLLVVLVTLKTLELRAKRDAMVIFYLGFFLIMLGFFHSQNIPTAGVLLIGLTSLIAALINAHMLAGYPSLKEPFKIALRLVLWGAPLMVLLFMSFPRFSPLWGFPSSVLTKTGVTDTLTINSISGLAQDNAIAFRIKFPNAYTPDPNSLYFRGPVLDWFDGKTWSISARSTQPSTSNIRNTLNLESQPISYEITIESTNQPWLFTLELTTAIQQAADFDPFLANNHQWLSNTIISNRLLYKATAYTRYQFGLNLPPQQQRFYTLLPPTGNLRTRAWATQLMGDPQFSSLNSKEKADWILQKINTEEYFYTLTPPLGYTPENAADQLWFDHRSGFCEHYAFSFAILMRALNIPARIVTGYAGAEPNYLDNYWIVRQSNAHAWTEIWQENEGWIRIDPTSAIAPERILSTINTQNTSITDGYASLGIFDKILMRWDALENMWNQWILAYNNDTGLSLLERLGFESPNWMTLFKTLLTLFSLFLFLAACVYKWKHRQKDAWLKVYTLLIKKLQKSGYNVSAKVAPRTIIMALQSQSKKKATQEKSTLILLELEKLRYAPSSYAPNTIKKDLQKLKKLILQLKI